MSAVLTLGNATQLRPHIGKASSASLTEFIDQFEVAIREKRDLACRLNEALDEIAAIDKLYQQRRAQFDSEKQLLNSEIDKLRTQVLEISKTNEKKVADTAVVQSLLETRERLVREEFGRKFQELTVEVRQQRKKYNEQVEKMKNQLEGCICQGSGWGT